MLQIQQNINETKKKLITCVFSLVLLFSLSEVVDRLLLLFLHIFSFVLTNVPFVPFVPYKIFSLQVQNQKKKKKKN
jgi:hypothetical protein